MKKYLDTSEVAQILGIAKPTVYRYIREGKLTPINLNDWQIEQKYQFKPEDVERVKATQEQKPGLTTTEAAKRIGCTTQTILKYIRDGKIQAKKLKYRGLERNFITEEEVTRFKESYDFKQQTHYIKDLKCYVSQLFQHQETKELARIIHLDERKEGIALTERENEITLQELLANYTPIVEMVIKPFITKKGYATFTLPKPTNMRSAMYSLMDSIQKQIGINNMRVSFEGPSVILEVKPTLLKNNSNDNLAQIDFLKSYLTEGKVIVREDALYLDSDIEAVQTYVSSKTKGILEKEAKRLGIPLHEFIRQLIESQILKS